MKDLTTRETSPFKERQDNSNHIPNNSTPPALKPNTNTLALLQTPYVIELNCYGQNCCITMLIQNYICCPQCFFLNGLNESITTDQPNFQHHNDLNDHDPPCTQSVGKLINSFEPHTQNTTNMKQNIIPTKHFIYQQFKNWLAKFLQVAGMMEILHQHQQSQIIKCSPKCEFLDGLVWRRFTGTRNMNDPPFMSNPGVFAFSIYVDWFNAHGKSTQLASIGPIMLICSNLPHMKD
ncbi:hypothetical protein O181_019951 [Austropuccinia psidii MF-1]|uniref:Uncharacterized protein n=1 Tax=Austropuccinia psidii MF-1 TaxID=1389203 RepID=A0A9Q3GUD6_9BASI|nr:hypothetical protein [Austropuccinia psidii MF-1]